MNSTTPDTLDRLLQGAGLRRDSQLAELLGAMRVTWTAHDRGEEAKSDAVIFEGCRPPVQYK